MYRKFSPLFITFPVFILILVILGQVITGFDSKLIVSRAVTLQFLPKPPTVERIFDQDHYWVATLSAQRVRTLIATGDVIPARSVNWQTVKFNNFNWPYEKTANILRSADLTFINLEAPLLKNCFPTQEGMVFCGDEKNVEGLIYAGVDVANLANNHAGNYGMDGILATSDLLARNNILATGILGPVITDVRGLRFAFLGYNDVGVLIDAEKMKQEISQAKQNSDVVVVAIHWGTEYTSQPDARQRTLARLAIDKGADLIIGNHPHWIQPVEIYHNKLITYAHGNFVFDQMWSQETEEGVVGKYTFYDDKLIDVEFLPVQIENYGQPNFLAGKEKQAVLDEMRQESFNLLSGGLN